MCGYLEKARRNPPVSQPVSRSVSPEPRSEKQQQQQKVPAYHPSPRLAADSQTMAAKAPISSKLVSDFKPFSVDSCPEVLPDLSNHHSVMAQVLKNDSGLWGKLKTLRTQKDITFAHCIKTGLENVGHPIVQTM